ncbi:hypothetical protein Hamer_G003454 [Homarus americanus]|uniref:Uncharacterized protein n=1 Tax=Homarus americanus TaxID=6706 RepID=A0A8J5JYA4_HOMAM|nr:hypothetical protein Hamer_G003454 [Homarus americanus]
MAAHALSGCEIIAHLHDIGKVTAIQTLKSGRRLDKLGKIVAEKIEDVYQATRFVAACYPSYVYCLTMSASTVNQETCPICREDLDVSDVVELRQKGADGINSASVQRGDDVVVSAGEKVHITCRKSRSDVKGTVKGRIEYYGCDLHAADCIYHRSCSGNLRSGLSIPLQFQNVPEAKRRKSGRPKNEDEEQAFMNVCSYLENNDEEQLTISHLREKMKEFLTNTDSEPYGNQYLKGQLKEQYGDNVHFAEGEGLYDIVTMREKRSQILRPYFNIQA